MIDAELYKVLKHLREKLCQKMDDAPFQTGAVIQLERLDAIDTIMEMISWWNYFANSADDLKDTVSVSKNLGRD